jgi:broad specificity phosphatase PhoE
VARLFLVRHGESTWNAEGRWQGQADPPLSARGEAQAAQAARTLAALRPFDAIVASTLQRARRTAELLAATLRTDVHTHPDLVERAAGPWHGLPRSDIEASWPGWLADGRRPDGYEPDEDLRRRATAALAHLCRDLPGARILVVSHGGVIAALERHHDDPSRPPTLLGNLEGRWFEYDHDDPDDPDDPDGDRLRPTGPRVALIAPPTDHVALNAEPAAVE